MRLRSALAPLLIRHAESPLASRMLWLSVVRSSCLWAQHATSFWLEVLAAERQQPSSAPEWHYRLLPMPACPPAIPYQTLLSFPSGQRTWPCQSWLALASLAQDVGQPVASRGQAS